jgi:deoxyribonuclease-4
MLPQIASAVRQVLERSADSPARLIVENSAGAGGCVGCRFEEVGAIVDASDSERVAVCLDTAHCFASGYDIRTAEAVEEALQRFDDAVGLDRLVAIHANDSRVPLGANADRHANIGEGHLGLEAFSAMLNHPRLRERDLPWILEVPGDGQGPDLVNVNRLRDLAGLPPAVPREAVVAAI